jgi:hypothetical protein
MCIVREQLEALTSFEKKLALPNIYFSFIKLIFLEQLVCQILFETILDMTCFLSFRSLFLMREKHSYIDNYKTISSTKTNESKKS